MQEKPTENDEAPAVAISSPNEFVGLFRTAMKSSGLPIEIIDAAALYALNQLIPEAVPGGLQDSAARMSGSHPVAYGAFSSTRRGQRTA